MTAMALMFEMISLIAANLHDSKSATSA
jgi:hypothetical protein